MNRTAAHDLIAKLRKSNGALSAKAREYLEKECPEDLEAIQNVRRKLGSSTRTLATNLYAKETRFVYELIQNAEDNCYSRARRSGEQPFLHFTLYPDRIVVDSNEDGFQAHNVAAICSTGESTKKSSGYIGEKGIGFKSVFKIAKKVHIQSEPFSFSFEYDHDADDDGLGMVTPIEEPYLELPANIQTRMTLTLLKADDFGTRKADLDSLPDTLLLFLENIRELSITIKHADGATSSAKVKHESDSTEEIETITLDRSDVDGSSTHQKSRFLVSREKVVNLPNDSSRKNIHDAMVVLAFPIDEESQPRLQNQHVFAYLPLRQVGFKFLIQSDFITQASREDVFDNARNRALLDGVAHTFRNAVLSFVQHDTLQYTWMRYLPNNSVSDEFWSKLVPKIEHLLRETKILRSWTSLNLYKPGELKFLPAYARDTDGDPFFADILPELYLARAYVAKDYKALIPLGCTTTNWSDMYERVAADLKSADSTMKSPATSMQWHSEAAKFLSIPFKEDLKSSSVLKALELIPLNNGSWVSTNTCEVYFPEIGPCEVPRDLDLLVVDETAVENDARRDLFLDLGVRHCDPVVVVRAIFRKHGRQLSLVKPSVFVHHLSYLYYHNDIDDVQTELASKSTMGLVASNSKTGEVSQLRLSEARIYLYRSKTKPDAMSLFGAVKTASIFGGADKITAPGLSVWILHDSYRRDAPAKHHGLPWMTWLEQSIGILRVPPAFESNATELSEEFKYLAKYRSDMLLQLLQQNWPQYSSDLTKLRKILGNHQVRSNGDGFITLNQAYAPTTHLKDKAYRYHLNDSIFVPIEFRQNDYYEDWMFLRELGVRFQEDLVFFLAALQALIACGSTNEIKTAVFEVYSGLEHYANTHDNQALLKSSAKSEIVYIPPEETTEPGWVSLNECRWNGPDWYASKTILNRIPPYSEHRKLFVALLGLKDVNHKDVISELKTMKIEKSNDKAKISNIYQYLENEFRKDENPKFLVDEFEENALVFCPRQNQWARPSECVWADERTSLPDRISISGSYMVLADFFQEVLKVPKPSISMRVTALLKLAKESRMPEIKEEIIRISALSPGADDLKSLRKTNIFPVRTGKGVAKLTNSESVWLIPDHKEYADAFVDHPLNILDYSLAEIQRAQAFLIAMGMDKNFMSVAVREITKPGAGRWDVQLTNAFKERISAIFRCANHFSGLLEHGEGRELLKSFASTRIYTSNNILKSLEVYQDDRTFSADSCISYVHMDTRKKEWEICVPANEDERDICYMDYLPREISKALNLSSEKAESVIGKILMAKNLRIVASSLFAANIPDFADIDCLRDFDSALQAIDVPVEGLRATFPEIIRDTPEVLTPSTSISEQILEESSVRTTDLTPRLSRASSTVAVNRSESYYTTPSAALHFQMRFRGILSHVISGAVNAVMPRNGSSFRAFNGAHHEPSVRVSQLSFSSDFDHNASIGAGGELFVFEFFTNLALPLFGQGNWQSRIRERVCVHERYANLPPWHGHETADIVYHDAQGALTKLLIEHGYFTRTDVIETPKYYLEVKTSTNQCDEVFYVSPNQFSLMERCRLRAGVQVEEVMIILRVFNLDRNGLGMRIFVDPDAHRRNGTLRFSVEKWLVQSQA